MPLNGTNVNPLSRHAVSVLQSLKDEGPKPCQRINQGVLRRFGDEHLVEIVDLPSPFMIHAGGNITHARITETGIARLAELAEQPTAAPKR